MAAEHELRLTLKACEDLDVDCDRAPDQLTEDHPLIKAFVTMRTQDVAGQETTQLPRSKNVVFNLHAGRWRGLTWWDEEAGVVWLLGGGYHRSGDRTDAYEVLKSRDAAGELFPTRADYLRLGPDTPTAEAFAKDLEESAGDLLGRAKAHLGEELRHCFGGVLDVRVMAADGGLWIGLLQPPRVSGVLPGGYQVAVLAALLPGVDLDEIDFAAGSFPGTPHPNHEFVVRAPLPNP